MSKRTVSINDITNVQQPGGLCIARNGEFLVFSARRWPIGDKRATSQLYRYRIVSGALDELTAPANWSAHPTLSPDDVHVAFTRKPNGNEKPQLYVMALDGGEARCLTEAPLGVAEPRWLPSGSGLILRAKVRVEAPTLEGTAELIAQEQAAPGPPPQVTEDRVYRFWDRWLTTGEYDHFFRFDLETKTLSDLTPTATRWLDLMETMGAFDISPGGRELCFAANSTESPFERLRSAIYIVPTSGGETRCLTPDNPAADVSPRYSADGRFIVYGKKVQWDYYADPVRLVRYDRQTGDELALTESWDGSAEDWIVDHERVLFLAQHRARVGLFEVPLDGGAVTQLVSGGAIGKLRCDTRGISYFVHNSLCEGPEISRWRRGGDIERLTTLSQSTVGECELGRVEDTEIISADGTAIQCWLVFPPDYDARKRYPLVHLLHGGPHNAWLDQLGGRWCPHLFASQGYIVALVNFRGSTSFGNDYAECILGAWGDKPSQDVLAATDEFIDRGLVDPERMAIAGGSYGGYLTTWLTTVTDRFKCAVCHAGVVDFAGMYAGDLSYGRFRAYGGRPWQDAERMNRWSPIQYSETMNTPMLILHGDRDYRVPVTQGLQLYGILKDKGVDARLVHFGDENHWILKPHNAAFWYREVHAWLERYLD